MDQDVIILNIAVLGASILQSATGIGFGVIAGPVMLVVLNSGTAIQISIALSFLIAVLLVPSLWRKTDRRLLAQLLAGSALGLPIGLAVFMSIGIDHLKALAGLAVLFTMVFMLRNSSSSPAQNPQRPANIKDLSVGVVSGIMSGSLAMPGPIPAAWMAVRAQGKDTIRATILTLFIFSYAGAFGLQAAVAGIAADTLWLTLTLAPATLAGVAIGRVLASRVSEQVFRQLLLAVLAATTLSLLYNSLPNLMAS